MVALGGGAVSYQRGTPVVCTGYSFRVSRPVQLYFLTAAERKGNDLMNSYDFHLKIVGGEVRIHPENARMSGRHGVQYVAQCVACAALTLFFWQ